MNSVNNVAPAVSYELSGEVARSLDKSPLMMKIVFFSFLTAWFGSLTVLMFVDPENSHQYRFYGILAFIASFAVLAVLKKLFLGRAVGAVSDELTRRLGQSAAFRKVLYATLMQTPWSKHRLNKGRYKEARFEDIMVLFKDGSHTSFNLAKDFSSISIVPPNKTV
jgi:hypothetical protein